jgi:hypothetical protein
MNGWIKSFDYSQPFHHLLCPPSFLHSLTTFHICSHLCLFTHFSPISTPVPPISTHFNFPYIHSHLNKLSTSRVHSLLPCIHSITSLLTHFYPIFTPSYLHSLATIHINSPTWHLRLRMFLLPAHLQVA